MKKIIFSFFAIMKIEKVNWWLKLIIAIASAALGALGSAALS